MPAFRVQYASDLHLEVAPGLRLRRARGADALALTGDIGDPGSTEYAAFLEACAAEFDTVLILLGNHEGYGYSWDEAVALARAAAASPACRGRVHVLERDAIELVPGRLRCIGATMWTEVPDDLFCEASRCIGDHTRIKGWSVYSRNAAHARDVAWLRAEIERAEANGVGLLVLTHHAPSTRGTGNPRYAGDPLACAYAVDLETPGPRCLLRSPVRAWLHGHTHHSYGPRPAGLPGTTRSADAPLLASNQRGYAGDSDDDSSGFVPDAVLDIAF